MNLKDEDAVSAVALVVDTGEESPEDAPEGAPEGVQGEAQPRTPK